MFRRFVFQDRPFARQMLGGSSSTLFAAGLALVLFGVTVLLVPQILVALIAAAFLGAGSVVLGLAWQARRLERIAHRTTAELWEPPPFDDPRF